MTARSISIILPFYKKKRALRKTLSELLLQVDHEDELIVVNDYSPGGVGACGCLKELTIIKPPRLDTHIYRLNTLRNLGIEKAKNDAVIILDPDCVPNDYFLENARKMFDPSVMFAGKIDKYNEDGTIKEDPRNKDSRWIDTGPNPGSEVYGGCMFFSKTKALMAGGFDEAFDGSWGAEEHEFSNRMYHIGVRLRYAPELQVKHLWHPKWTGGASKNIDLWKQKTELNKIHIPGFDPYVIVHLIGWTRPEYVDQVMRCIFRERIPIKVRFVNLACKKTAKALDPWRDRIAVDVVDLPEKMPPAKVRNMSMQYYADKGNPMMIFLDDDIFFKPGLIEGLLRDMINHPEYHAITGGVIDKIQPRRLGGRVINKQHKYFAPFTGVKDSDFVSCGVLAVRLDPLVLFDDEYRFGWNDWDWSNILTTAGFKLGCSGDRTAYHRMLMTSHGLVHHKDRGDYAKFRYDRERINAMTDRYEKKWGYRPSLGGILNE